MMSDLRETTFTWTVHNFDVAPQTNGERLESPLFSIDAMKYSQFSLMLYPRGSRKEDGNYVCLSITRHNDSAANISSEIDLCLIDGSGKCTNVHKSSGTEFDRGENLGYNRFYERSLLLGSGKSSLLPDNKLTVRCRMLPRQDEAECEYKNCLSDCEELSRDFAELLKSGIHSDLTIEAEGREFRAHKAILEARCPQLMSELGGTKTLNIKASVLKAILSYIYTGIFESIENIHEVFEAANRYELAGLKTLLFPYSYSLSAKTVIKCSEVAFEWIIPDFKNFLLSDKEVLYFLVSDDIPKSNWMKVALFAKKHDDGKKDTFLKFHKFEYYNTMAVYFKIQTTDQNNKVILLKESENLFESDEFVTPFDIGMISNKMLVNGDLKLHFHLRASTDSQEESSVQKVSLINARSHALEANRSLKILQKDLRYFYDTLDTGDVTLNVGSLKLTAHKAVLCSRSEVFCKMFQHDTLESRTNSVDIEDMDEEAMMSVLKYMYCGESGEVTDVRQAIDRHSAADKYQLLALKENCCQYLKSNIDAENFGEVLLLADAHSDEVLKESVHMFITGNAKKILESQQGLKVLENRGDLYKDIFCVVLRCLSEQNNADGRDEKVAQ